MGARSEARRAARERALERKRLDKALARMQRQTVIRVVAVGVAVLVAGLTDDWWAARFDALIGVLGDSSTAAAFVGWLAAFAVVVYAAVVLLARRRWAGAFAVTWPVGVLLLVPAATLQPSRTERSRSIEDRFFFLGSFFDTYHVVIGVVAVVGLVSLLVLWLAVRKDDVDGRRLERATGTLRIVNPAILVVGTVGTLVWALVGFA